MGDLAARGFARTDDADGVVEAFREDDDDHTAHHRSDGDQALLILVMRDIGQLQVLDAAGEEGRRLTEAQAVLAAVDRLLGRIPVEAHGAHGQPMAESGKRAGSRLDPAPRKPKPAARMPYSTPTTPVAQLALDFVNIEQALRVAHEAAAAGPLWLEAGTPLIKAEGLEAVRRLRAAFPDATIIADMKVMDAGRVEVEFARKAGADIVSVLAASTDATLAECVDAARRVGCAVFADLVAVPDPVARAKEVERLGVDIIGVHLPIDRQMQGSGDEVFSILKAVASAVTIPVACAGGITPATAARAVAAGARIVIVGGAVTKVPDARGAAAQLLATLAGAPVADAGTFRRVGLDEVRSVLNAVSTPNLCDAMHGHGALRGFIDRNPGKRLCGPARTVLCPAGDWSKPVQAIDACRPGDVLVIDAGDGEPALWGGLASRTAAARKLGGVVIRGACRDLADIRALPLPLWATRDCPDAGVPRGAGTLDVPLHLGAVEVQPGDWIVGDEDGLVRIAARDVVAVANRARDIAERELRFAAEIDRGITLAQIAELKKWEQR